MNIYEYTQNWVLLDIKHNMKVIYINIGKFIKKVLLFFFSKEIFRGNKNALKVPCNSNIEENNSEKLKKGTEV